jgi:hypothetical protein
MDGTAARKFVSCRMDGGDNIQMDLMCVGFGDDRYKLYKWLQVLQKNAFWYNWCLELKLF